VREFQTSAFKERDELTEDKEFSVTYDVRVPNFELPLLVMLILVSLWHDEA
jgi:hypothetical protein